MPAITLEEIAASYDVGLRRINGELSEAGAIETLTIRFGMNRSSANDYIDALRHMLNGEVFKRTISGPGADYYIGRIASDFDGATARRAVDALRRHIAYYEPTRGVICHTLRNVVTKYGEATAVVTGDQVTQTLEQAVEQSLTLTSSERSKLLPPAGHKPAVRMVQINSFTRNPHVIAEVLSRANGVCEWCRRPAPFLRASNGLPYLEVHHRTRLADGGEDTVTNAEAICPNCHRQRHYG